MALQVSRSSQTSQLEAPPPSSPDPTAANATQRNWNISAGWEPVYMKGFGWKQGEKEALIS